MSSSVLKKPKGRVANDKRQKGPGMGRNVLFAVAMLSMAVSVFNLIQKNPHGLGKSWRVLVNSFIGSDSTANAKQPFCDPATGGICSADEAPDNEAQSIAQPVHVNAPKGANAAGKPRDAPKDCIDRHAECVQFHRQGECIKNPGWMIVNCPKSCNDQVNACALRDPKLRCSRTALNMSTSPIYKNGYQDGDQYINGDLNNMFESIIDRYSEKYHVEVLSRDPWVVVFENFTTPEEGSALINSIQRWERSTDTGQMNEYGESGRVLSTGRTSSNGWCNNGCGNHPLVENVFARIEEVTHIPRNHYESFQVLRYEVNQHYNVHHDYGAEDVRLACGPRILTFFLYLSDVEEGGETAFPQLRLAIKPKRGRAVLWPSTLDHNLEEIDSRTMHAAQPVKKGKKMAANAWIHLFEYQKPNLWGCTGSFDEL